MDDFGQMIHMKFQVVLCLKKKKRKIKLSSAVVVISTLRVKFSQ